MRGRSGWAVFLVIWGASLTGGLLGAAASWAFFTPHAAPSASNLRWLLGGTLFMGLSGTVGALRRRRRKA